jgi:hypothetical protein
MLMATARLRPKENSPAPPAPILIEKNTKAYHALPRQTISAWHHSQMILDGSTERFLAIFSEPASATGKRRTMAAVRPEETSSNLRDRKQQARRLN